jgi:hypothetical protein
MSTQTVTCPHCQTLLRSDRPVPAGANLRCPDCKSAFTAPDDPPVARSLFGPPFVIAATVSLLLGGAIITAALIFSSPKKDSPPLPETKAANAAEEKRVKELVEKLAKVQRDAKRKEFLGLMERGVAHLNKKRYPEAKEEFQKAIDLMPGDKEALQGLLEAEKGAEREKSRLALQEKNRLEAERLLSEGSKALLEK